MYPKSPEWNKHLNETIDKLYKVFEVNLPYKIKENNVVRHLLSLLEGTQYNGLLKDFIQKAGSPAAVSLENVEL